MIKVSPSFVPTCRVWKSFSLISILLLAFSFQANAQVVIRFKMNKSNYMLNEPVTATVYISNHAGRQLVFEPSNAGSWLNLNLISSGRSISPARRMNYAPVVIPAGKTVSRTVSLSSSYALGRVGNYTCTASVNMPGAARTAFVSGRRHFTIAKGRPFWVQRAGIPSAPNEIREYKLTSFLGNRALELYAEVSSVNTGENIRTIALGTYLRMRKPTATLDGENNMHALFQIKPNIYTHVSISPTGKVLAHTQHRRGAEGAPRLVSFGNGEVKVAGTIPFNAKAEAAKAKKIHGVTDRPGRVYRK